MFVGVVVIFSKINDFTLLHTSFASFAVAIATVVYSSVCTKCACFFFAVFFEANICTLRCCCMYVEHIYVWMYESVVIDTLPLHKF